MPTTKPTDPRAAVLAACSADELDLIQEMLKGFTDVDEDTAGDGGDIDIEVTAEGAMVARRLLERLRAAGRPAGRPCA